MKTSVNKNRIYLKALSALLVAVIAYVFFREESWANIGHSAEKIVDYLAEKTEL